MSKNLNCEAGFTLQELLVVIFVGSILLSMCLSGYLFIEKMRSTEHQKQEMTAAANSAINQILFDVQRANMIAQVNDSIMILEYPNRKIIEYRTSENNIYRNGLRIVIQDQYSVVAAFARVNNKEDANAVEVNVKAQSKKLQYSINGIAASSMTAKKLFNKKQD